MGLPMALNLARNRPTENNIDVQHLTVYDVNRSNMDRFVTSADDEGLNKNNNTCYSTASNLSDVAESNPDYIVTSLPTCEASESVVRTLLDSSLNNKKNEDFSSILIDTSTISVSTSRKLHDLITSFAPSGNYIDAPVSGGVKGATDASLTFMVGCSSSSSTFESITPLLSKMGRTVIPCGSPGSGAAAKLCNNAALAAQMIGICEAMNLGEALGVDPKVLAGAMNASTARCWSSTVNNPHPAAARSIGGGASANDYAGGFGSALMLKDLNLAMEEADGQGLFMPVSGLTRRLYERADADGYGAKDFGVMLKYLREVEMDE